MKNQEEYIKNVVNALERSFSYTRKQADKAVETYEEVINIVGEYGKSHQTAHFLNESIKSFLSPEYYLDNYKTFNTIFDLTKTPEVDKKGLSIIQLLKQEYDYTNTEARHIYTQYYYPLLELNKGMSWSHYDIAVFLNKMYKNNIIGIEWFLEIIKYKKENAGKDIEINKIPLKSKLELHKHKKYFHYNILSDNEREVVDYLGYLFRFSLKEALQVFSVYYEVYTIISGFKKNGDDAYSIGEAYLSAISPESWLEQLHITNQVYEEIA
jgi:hypothetical protein